MGRRLIATFVLASLFGWSIPVARAATQPASAHGHSCCAVKHAGAAVVVDFVTSSMPCGDEHPCCAKQRPADRTSLPTVVRVPRPDSEPLARFDEPVSAACNRSAASTSPDLFQFYSLRSTILRI